MPELTKAIILQRLEEMEQEKRARIPTKYRRSESEENEFVIDKLSYNTGNGNPANK